MVIVTSWALAISAVKFGGLLPPGGLPRPSSQARLDAATAVHREDGEHRAGVDVVVVGLHAGHRVHQVAVAAHARRISIGLLAERDLAWCW